MQLSTTTKYAIRILGLMGQNSSTKFSSKELSEKLDIPYKYLAKIMTKLTKNKIVSSSKGKLGGFVILKSLKDIYIIDIVIVFDDVDNEKCVLSEEKCNFKQKCIMHEKWTQPRCVIDDFFTKTTLFEIIGKDLE